MIFTGVVHLEYLQFYVSVVVVRRFSGGVGTSAVQWFVATSTYISVVVLVHTSTSWEQKVGAWPPLLFVPSLFAPVAQFLFLFLITLIRS